eukprot:TRINITY_DN5654_c0_g1_i1.p1 TRINITY_DN5654_c0_g1~~TRINITY_DN5654_c0_g1_i1.p1  ORF type:complete len:261 (+),score=68.01 TRINITY_DN5654_c0_g1_i1:18-800(+)
MKIVGEVSASVCRMSSNITKIVEHFNKLQEDPETKRNDDLTLGDPKSLRLRDLRGIAPSKVFMDSQLVKDVCTGYSFSGFHLLVQKLPEGQSEVKDNKDTIVFFLQQFHPETWELGKRFEFTTTDDEKLTEFRDRISSATGVKSLSFVGGKGWEGQEILSLPKLKWITPKEETEDETTTEPSYLHNMKVTVKSLYLYDGDLVYFKDNEKVLKDLTDEEKAERKQKDTKIKQGWHSLRWPTSASDKESGLVIKDHSKNVTI